MYKSLEDFHDTKIESVTINDLRIINGEIKNGFIEFNFENFIYYEFQEIMSSVRPCKVVIRINPKNVLINNACYGVFVRHNIFDEIITIGFEEIYYWKTNPDLIDKIIR